MVSGDASHQRAHAVEWPTLVLAVVIYGGWLVVTAFHAMIPWPFLLIGGAWLIAWQSSLQHEVIHGHPTNTRAINDAIGFPPLALWLPYSIYRREHIAHHTTPHLTDPFDDSESNYLPHPGGLAHALAALEAILASRLIVGPPIRVCRFWWSEMRRLAHNPVTVARDWLPHLVGVMLVILWLNLVGLSLSRYLLLFVWPGIALSLIRSFAEHRASADPSARTALVTDFGPLALLFLNNNLHTWHHARPGVPWYRLPTLHHADPQAFAQAPRYPGYGAIIARYMFRPHDRLVHPGR